MLKIGQVKPKVCVVTLDYDRGKEGGRQTRPVGRNMWL